MVGVGLLEGGGLVIGQFQLERGDGFGQVMRSGRADDRGAGGATVKTVTISGATVLTNVEGFMLYSFAPDAPAKSNCNGTCAHYWPPVPGPVAAAAGVTGRLGTIKRSDGSAQATYNGHPLYTYIGDTSPGQAKGDGLNLSGGVWHEVTASGAAAPAGSGSPSSSPGSGYGYRPAASCRPRRSLACGARGPE